MSGRARIVFLGTGEIAAPAFEWLIGAGHQPVGLVTQPDRPAGRHRELKSPPIKLVADAAGIPVLQPERVREAEALDAIEALRPDLIVVMAYGQILPQRLISMAPLGCVNLHASLLPKYRGAACIQAAIDAGDETTGVTLMHVVKQLDAGDVILAEQVPIEPSDTAGTLHDKLALAAVEALREGLPGLLAGTAPRVSQDQLGESSHVAKLDRADGRIDWRWTAEKIARRTRAYDPWPGCWAVWEENGVTKRLKIFPASACDGSGDAGLASGVEGRVRVACGEGMLELGEVQPDGARRMTASDWWRGLRSGPAPRLH